MKQFLLKFLPIFLLYLSTFTDEIKSDCGGGYGSSLQDLTDLPHLTELSNLAALMVDKIKGEENYEIVHNIFEQETKIEPGNVMQCEVTKKMLSNNKDIHAFTQVGKNLTDYIFFPVSKTKKCFSFEVRTKLFPHIILSSGPIAVEGQRLEVIFDYNGKSVIRTKDRKFVSSIEYKGIVNEKESSGFWIRWLDNQLIEVGRSTDNQPILSHRMSENLNINFIGILSYTTDAEWNIHYDPKCGPYNVTTRTETETKCKLIKKDHLFTDGLSNLQKSQENIFNQMKLEREIFNKQTFKSKEILLEYQAFLRKNFKNAEQYQKQINIDHNDSSLGSHYFEIITREYFKFFEEIHKELSLLKDRIETVPNNDCCCCGGD